MTQLEKCKALLAECREYVQRGANKPHYHFWKAGNDDKPAECARCQDQINQARILEEIDEILSDGYVEIPFAPQQAERDLQPLVDALQERSNG